MKKILSILLVGGPVSFIHAQVTVVDSGAAGGQINISSNYTQSFDTLTGTGSSAPWTDNSTLRGWYATQSSYNLTSPSGLTSSGTETDRSLGAATNAQLGNGISVNSFAVRFVNGTSSAINGFSVSFDGEQWRRRSNSPQIDYTLFFSYQIFDANQGSVVASSSWVSVADLNFTSPNATLTTSEFLDGNAAENRIANINTSVTGISLAPGQELWLRWSAYNPAYPQNPHGLSIDNLSVGFTAIPEPAACTVLLGGLALLIAHRRRCKAPLPVT